MGHDCKRGLSRRNQKVVEGEGEGTGGVKYVLHTHTHTHTHTHKEHNETHQILFEKGSMRG
jgi:hypothetical protein